VLRLQHILAGKSFAYNFMNKPENIAAFKQLGFTKVIITDGFDSAYRYDLEKK